MIFKNVCFTLHVCDVRTVNIYCRNYRMCYTLANMVRLKNIQWTSFLCSSMNIYSIYVCVCLSVLLRCHNVKHCYSLCPLQTTKLLFVDFCCNRRSFSVPVLLWKRGKRSQSSEKILRFNLSYLVFYIC